MELREWLVEQEMLPEELAVIMSVPTMTVCNWLWYSTVPTVLSITALQKMSEGAITAQDFLLTRHQEERLKEIVAKYEEWKAEKAAEPEEPIEPEPIEPPSSETEDNEQTKDTESVHERQN